jgi:hypothetical protein
MCFDRLQASVKDETKDRRKYGTTYQRGKYRLLNSRTGHWALHRISACTGIPQLRAPEGRLCTVPVREARLREPEPGALEDGSLASPFTYLTIGPTGSR